MAEITTHEEELRAALRAIVADVLDYERVNNLSPNPGRKYCWDSVARAKAILDLRQPPNEKLEAFRREIVGEDIREMMAADRREQQSYPRNNFALTALVLVGLIMVIGLAFAFGLVK